jgi:hypothetical protein
MEKPVRNSKGSMAGVVMNEAIDLAIEGNSPYPNRAAFVDAEAPTAGLQVRRAADRGRSVVLVSADGTSRVLEPGRKIEPRRSQPPRAA